MLNLLRDMGISKKIFLIPALLLTLILFQNIFYLRFFNNQYESSLRIKDEVYAKMAIVENITQHAININSNVYRLYTLFSLSSVNLDESKPLLSIVEKSRNELKANIEKLGAMAGDQKEADFIKDLEEHRQRYDKAIGEVVSMIETDVAIAFMYQNEANMGFDEMSKNLEELKQNNTRQTVETFENAIKDSMTAKYSTYWIFGISLLVSSLFSYVIARAITVPIVSIKHSMSELARGNTDIDIHGKDNKDEIGDMARAVEVFKDNAVKTKHMEAAQKQAEAKAEQEKRAVMQKLADDFEKSIMGIVETVSSAAAELNATAESMSEISDKTSKRATAVAAASEQAAANVHAVASSSEEMASSIAKISVQVSEEAGIAKQAVEQVNETNNVMDGLSQSAKRISDVVNLITDIAEQTNLLALNATIEAARAGEAGRGFAVVANEVKNLASQTAKATEEISSQISDVQSKTGHAVEAISKIGEVIKRIHEISGSISSAVEQQGAATSEISNNAEQVAKGTTEVSSNITGVTQAATEAGAASGQVLTASQDLSKNAAELKTEVTNFIGKIRKS